MDAGAWPVTDRAPPLAAAEVHVWLAPLALTEDAISRLEAVLSDEERRRAERFHFRRDRLRYIAGRGQLRELLGEYLGREPSAVRLWYTSHGKPGLVGEDNPGDLRFNVAHSEDLILYAVTRGREVGVDVERARPLEWRELAARYFAPREVAELNALAPAAQEHAFFACWTRKEAYIKALSFGLTVPLDRFAVTLAPDAPAALASAEHDPAQLGRWALRELTPAPGYVGALAVEGRDWRLRCGRRDRIP
jgi:4'-phosphopantetheinyl transferase